MMFTLCTRERYVTISEKCFPHNQPTFYLQTVEINNTDAEGRLVLADGVAYAARYETLKLSHTFSDCGLRP